MSPIQTLINRFSRGHPASPVNNLNAENSETTENITGNESPVSKEGLGISSYNHDGVAVEEPVADAENQPGELTFAEDTAGGMGRHLGLFSTTFLMLVMTIPLYF